MGAVPDTFIPVTNENFVNNVEKEFNKVEDEVIVRKAYSNSKFGSNYSDGA
jgi:hypothetical protein